MYRIWKSEAGVSSAKVKMTLVGSIGTQRFLPQEIGTAQLALTPKCECPKEMTCVRGELPLQPLGQGCFNSGQAKEARVTRCIAPTPQTSKTVLLTGHCELLGWLWTASALLGEQIAQVGVGTDWENADPRFMSRHASRYGKFFPARFTTCTLFEGIF